MELLLKIIKWIIGCWLFLAGTAVLVYMSDTRDFTASVLVLFSYGGAFLLFETKSIKRPLFFTSVVVILVSYVITLWVLTPLGYYYKNDYVTTGIVLALLGLPVMHWAYKKWDD